MILFTVLQKIADSEMIGTYEKHQAMRDIEFMKKHEAYGKRCDYNPNAFCLEELFIYEHSLLGQDFWKSIEIKLNEEDNSIRR